MMGDKTLRKYAVIDGFYLKLIAVVTMIIDHVGLALFPSDSIFRIIGRIAFPIYCFLIVEGFFYTKNVGKYIGRLTIFAFISELPFDMVANNAWIDITSQNVFFTLLIGLLTIYFINRQFNEMKKSIILIIGMVVSIVLMTDYTCYGVALIYVFYLLRDRRGTACLLMALMSVVMGPAQGFAALSTIPIMQYSGRKGPKFADTSIVKYGFYVVYPLHLLVIFMIKLYLIGIAG